ncbi:hypothetical protein CP533_0799 [Ophiocordyceps camponoti-saundersi (nom. inval.)]|nr:hypothetical protein CP533_0799 [Ophiocordyceps camponoti-saundersi (nom. inval.)]
MVQLSKRKADEEPVTDKEPDAAGLKRQKLPVRAKVAEKGTLVTFDDDGNADQTTANLSAPKSVEEKVMQVSEDDEDAAPEALSTVRVATELKQSEQAAQRSARKKAAEEKQKRQERDTLLKKQAEERKRTAPDAATAATDNMLLQDDDRDASDKMPTVTGGRRRAEKTAIPEHLPAELLDDSSSEDEEQEQEQAQERRQTKSGPDNHRKPSIASVENRLTRLDKAPRDQAVRSTVFRVATEVDARLAPKASRESMGMRKQLLRRKRNLVRRRGFSSNV